MLRITAVAALFFSVFGKLNGVLQSIPQAVLGGIMLLLFGTIATVGVQNLIRNKVNFDETRNLIIAGVTLTVGIGGAVLEAGTFVLSGVGLAAVVGILLNLILPKTKEAKA